MRIATGFPIALALSVVPSHGQPAPGSVRQQFRCEVPYFTGATAPQGVSVKMTVVSDGLACAIPNWGVPGDRRNPATTGDITDAPQHGTAVFFSPTTRYIADRGYVGPDAFAYRATVRDGDGLERVMTVRVDVDVRPTPFDRTPGATRVSVLIPAGPIRVGNDVPVPRKTKDVRPAPPPDAQAASLKAAVVLDATIDPDGRVSSARVVRSIPLLDAAAVAAVRQWEFTPTVIDGRAVAVIMTVTVNFTPRDAASTPPSPATRSTAPDPPAIQAVRVGAGIAAPNVTRRVNATYTTEAMRAGVQGAVAVDVTIDPLGRVSDAKVVRSIPLLDAAAVAAARQWEFAPTLIDGRPVPIIATIEVTFSLAPPSVRTSAASSGPSLPPASVSAGTLEADIETALQYLQRRQYDDALKAFRQANDRRGEKCALCYVGMARAYESLGAAKNVVESCDRAIAVANDDNTTVVQAKQLKAIALQDLAQGKDPKRLREAEAELSAALALDPAANYLHFNLGLVLLREGRDADGVAELKAELALRPNGPQAERARSMIENPRRARESFAPRFSVVTLDRELVDLDALKGKVVLLDFWGTWCPPCVAAVPTLKELQKKHARDTFVILSVSSDSEETVVRTFTEKNRIVWPQYWDRDRKVQQAFDVRAYPTYVLIDDEGVVRFRTSGGGLRGPVGLEDAIKKLLKAAANRAAGALPGRVGS